MATIAIKGVVVDRCALTSSALDFLIKTEAGTMLATLYLADMYVPVKTCLSDFHYHISTQFENARLKLYSEYITSTSN